MLDDTDADFVRIPRPRTFVRGLMYLVHLRADRLKAPDRSDVTTTVVAVPSDSGRACVASWQCGDRWAVMLGLAGHVMVPYTLESP